MNGGRAIHHVTWAESVVIGVGGRGPHLPGEEEVRTTLIQHSLPEGRFVWCESLSTLTSLRKKR